MQAARPLGKLAGHGRYNIILVRERQASANFVAVFSEKTGSKKCAVTSPIASGKTRAAPKVVVSLAARLATC